MSQPKVNANELQGALGTQPAGDPYMVFLGPTQKGPFLPAAFGRTKDVIANFGAGPAVAAMCSYIASYGKPAIIVRTDVSVVASADAINVTGITGTSTVTVASAATAIDDFDLGFRVVNGGTTGTTGITYQTTKNGGKNWGAVTALGTGLTITVPNTGGVGFTLTTAGTLLANDTATVRVHAPNWDSSDLGDALNALKSSAYNWEGVAICGAIDATSFAALGTAFGSMPEKWWIGHTRNPNAGETESAYLSALNAIFSSLSTNVGVLCAGGADVINGADLSSYYRPSLHVIAGWIANLSQEVDPAEIDLGTLPGVSIRDANGNPLHHDESVNPGLDDARFTVLRTVDGESGVFVNNARIFSASGSDFEFIQHRRVFNVFKKALRLYFQRRLSKAVEVDADTGYILEEEAVEIERGADSILSDLLLSKPMASGGRYARREFVKVSRTDNLLSTKTMNVDAGVIPLAYPKTINIDEGFYNPALQLIPN
jgi:hypothetical protein